MQALNVIVGVVNKRFLQSLYRKRRGPRGYGIVRILRFLLYSVAKHIFETRTFLDYMQKHPHEMRALGFDKLPHRSTVDDWKAEYWLLTKDATSILGSKYAMFRNIKFTLLDSAPLPDPNDPDAKSGKYSKGWFKGFKIHTNCDDLRVPLRAEFTTGNVHDSKPAPSLFVESPYTLGDAAYDAKKLKEDALAKGTVLIADENRRRKKKRKKRPILLKKCSYIREQQNNLLKQHIMQHSWTKTKGFFKKATFAFLSVLLLQAMAIYTLLETGEVNLKINEVLL
jgi:hypothetical protein